MPRELTLAIYVFILAIFVGFEVIARVPAVLHTPLMSATNAIHGIVLLGAMLIAGHADTPLLHSLALVAVVLGAANVFGGFAVTDRMLEMFRSRGPGSDAGQGAGQGPGRDRGNAQ
jgi:NAD(P) transhydrogenase subunit alpha